MVGNFVIQYNIVPRKDSGIPESGKFLLVEFGVPEVFLVESEILGFGIRNIFQGNRNPSSIYEESGVQNPRHGFQNPRLSWIPLHGTNSRMTHLIRVC